MRDYSDRRVLGAFRMVSTVTGTGIESNFTVEAEPLDIIRNRSGIYVVRDAPGMHGFTEKFDVQGVAAPGQQSFDVTVRDSDHNFLARRFQLQLPRKLAPVHDPDGIFRVQMYPGPAAPVAAAWALLRVSVIKSGAATRAGLPWALVVVKQKSDGTVLKTGITDDRGEALVAVPGLTMRAAGNGGGALLSSDVAVEVSAIFDPAHLSKDKDYVPDPDDLIARMGTDGLKRNAQQVTISSGKSTTITIEVTV
jgi:hypothetical protein